MRRDAKRAIYEIAEDQMGYVTSAQAEAAGIHPVLLVQLARRGRLQRVSRGVYRIVEFPAQPLEQYMHATLWPHGRRGVLSHETALSLYEISDIDPPKVHITIPAGVRVQREIPAHLVVHQASLAPADITRLEGMPITTPERTIRDCLAEHVGSALLSPAIAHARQIGMLDAPTAKRLVAELRNGAPAT